MKGFIPLEERVPPVESQAQDQSQGKVRNREQRGV